MKVFWKTFFVTLLGFSNLAVLAVVFHTYFDSHQGLMLFSKSETITDLKEEIHRQCEKLVNELKEGKIPKFTCRVKVNKKHKGASYTLRTKVKVTKNEEGGIVILGKGRIQNPTKHAAEADFCDDCGRTEEIDKTSVELSDVLGEIVAMAEDLYSETEEAVVKAYEEHKARDRAKKTAVLGKLTCESLWNSETKEFEIEEEVRCIERQLSRMNFMEREQFYHLIKDRLWKRALSEDDHFLKTALIDFNKPYKYALSVQTSAGLMRKYLEWEKAYETLDTYKQKMAFLKTIKPELDQTVKFMTPEQARIDMHFLNEGFDGALARLYEATKTLPKTYNFAPPTTPVDYEDIKKRTRHLY